MVLPGAIYIDGIGRVGRVGRVGSGKIQGVTIGLAGKTGAGKSCIARILQKKGWQFLDLDQVAHEILDIHAGSIVAEFGEEVLNNDGRVDRRILGPRVFAVPGALERLEKISYPWIEKEVNTWMAMHSSDDRVVEGINLHKTSIPEDSDAIIWVSAPLISRFFRIRKRDKRPFKEILMRFYRQRALNSKLFSGRTDTYRVENSNNEKKLLISVDRVLSRIRMQEVPGNV